MISSLLLLSSLLKKCSYSWFLAIFIYVFLFSNFDLLISLKKKENVNELSVGVSEATGPCK